VRASRRDGVTQVEVAALDRSGGGDLAPVLSSVVDSLQAGAPQATSGETRRTEDDRLTKEGGHS
jgi:cytochrome c biogenesis protein